MNQASLFSEQSDRGAVFSTDGRYRYRLWRRGGKPGRRLILGMLNPSDAGAERDDNTIRTVYGFADVWGCGRIDVVNLFALISSNPKVLVRAEDPIGPENDTHIRAVLAEAPDALIVAAWGQSVPRKHRGRVDDLHRLLGDRTVHCISRTKHGHPRHPLLLAHTTPLEVLWG